MLTSCGRFDDAEVQIAQGLALEPLSPVVMHGAAFNAYCAGRHALAMERGTRGIENDPHYFLIRLWLGVTYERDARHDGAIRELERAVELSGGAVTWVVGYLANACGAAGLRDRAEELLRDLLDRRQRESVDPMSLAFAYLGLGDRENALAWLERGVETGGMTTVLVRSEPHLQGTCVRAAVSGRSAQAAPRSVVEADRTRWVFKTRLYLRGSPHRAPRLRHSTDRLAGTAPVRA